MRRASSLGQNVAAAVGLESYPRLIKGGFQDYEGLGIKRPAVPIRCMFPSQRSGGCQEKRPLKLHARVVESWTSCMLTRLPGVHAGEWARNGAL
jgi:hypothetical protein